MNSVIYPKDVFHTTSCNARALQRIRLLQDPQRTAHQVQAARDVRLHGAALGQVLAETARAVERLLDRGDDVDLGAGVEPRPLLGEAPLGRHAGDFVGVDLAVDKVALIARRGVRDVCAKDDVVKGSRGPVRGARRGLPAGGADGREKVDGFGAALLVEDEDARASA